MTKINFARYNNVAFTVESAEELKYVDLNGIVDGMAAIVADDTDGGLYIWRPTSTTTADNLTVVAHDKLTVGRWHRILAAAGEVDLSNYATAAALTSGLAGKQPLDAQLTDLAGLSLTGNAEKVLRVNSGETAFELATLAAGSGDLLAANNLSDLVNAATARTNLGLGNVDNTSDAAKPVSTAQQTALDLKADLASPALTGTPTAPTAAGGTNTTQIATTAFVTSGLAGKESSITAGTTSQYWRGDKTFQTLDKAAVGLSNVDNTSDVAKPVSTAVQDALDLKQNLDSRLTSLSGLTLTGNGTKVVRVNAGETGFELATVSGGGGGDMLAANNLSDLANVVTARTNLGLGTLATQSGTFSGTSSGTNTGDQTITLTGDVTGSGTGSFAATIANGSVSLAKQADVATGTVYYRKTAGTGAPEVQTLATLKTDLGLTGTNSGDQDLSAYAPLASPTFTGTPAAPTAAGGTNTTQIATTAFVTAALGSYATLASPALTGNPTAPTQSAGNSSTRLATTAFVATSFAPLASPTLTGTPAAPTASVGTSTTQIATTAFVRTPSIQSVTSSATVTPTFSNDQVNITAQAAALALANPSGTAVDGRKLTIRIKDNGTARAISYGTNYRAIGVTLPTTTVVNKTLYLGLIFNNTDTKWDVVAVAQEA